MTLVNIISVFCSMTAKEQITYEVPKVASRQDGRKKSQAPLHKQPKILKNVNLKVKQSSSQNINVKLVPESTH